jgi:two-component system sporulation sensor kinase A
MQPSGGTLMIDMLLNEDETQVGVRFTDTGPGINPEIMPHLFEPFTTTKDSGIGLGLSICYGIVQKHGGQIVVDSQQGRGATITVWLPLITKEKGTGD